MEKRTLILMVTTTIIFVGFVIVQTIFFPPNLEQGERTKTPPADATDSPLVLDDQPVQQANKQDDTAATGEESEPSPQDQAAAALEAELAANEVENDRRFITIGSLAVDDPYRMLACFDTRGATLRRVELNARTKSGRLQYREVDDRSGYVGAMELRSLDAGLQIRLLGPGTPVWEATPKDGGTARIAVGDFITAFDAEPLTDVEDFERLLGETRPSDRIDLTVRSATRPEDAPRVFTVTTTRQPMPVIQPTPKGDLTAGDLRRRGFQFTLQKQAIGTWPDLDSAMRTANWEVSAHPDEGTIEFTYRLAAGTDHGPMEVVKRFSLPKVESGHEYELDRTYHIKLDIAVRNLSDQPQTVNYELVGPTGTPLEGWWYQQKIHGSFWAIGRMAGARDILSSTQAMLYKFISGPSIVNDRQSKPPQQTPIVNKGGPEGDHLVRFLSVDTKYFDCALLPADGAEYPCFSAFAIPASILPEKKILKRTADITFVMYSNEIELAGASAEGPSEHRERFEIFVGPKDPELLEIYGLQDARTFGWFAPFSQFLIWLLHILYNLTFGVSYGLAIVLLTVLVRSCMLPISRKAALNAQMMQHLQPEVKRITEKYKDDMEKKSQAIREFYAKHNYNPLSGCLPMFLQLPIFIGLYRGLSVDIALRDQPLIPGLSWCSNLAGPDRFLYWGNWMPSFLGAETGWLGPYLNILPICTIVLFLAQQKLFMPPATDDQQKFAQKMMTFMMLFMGVLFFKVPSGLCVYFITSSVWGIIERQLLPKPKLVNPPKFDESGRSPRKKNKESANGEQVSLPLRNDEEIENRKRRDRERKRKLKERN